MNKAQPWNINGVGFDAREAAREAARRQGKSLGEWLHGVIADHAEDHGLAPRAIGGQERIDAVTARLEQMGARPAADHARRGARARPDPRARSHRALDERDSEEFDQEDGQAPRAADRRMSRGAPERDDGDDLLENAIAAMERRSVRNERRTDQALASMAKLLEDTQARREQEYGDVAALARQALYWGHEASATALVWKSPLTSVVSRLGRMHLHRQVKDKWLRRQLTPDFTPGCKRMLVSSDYYPALQRDNCKLIDWPIATLSPVGVRTSDGVEHHLDCIVFATGYDVHLTGPPFPVTGLGGRSLSDELGRWRTGLQERQCARLPEPLHDDRPELWARPQFAAGLHRGSTRLRRPRHYHHPGQ